MKKPGKRSVRNEKPAESDFKNGVRGKYFGRVGKNSPVFFRTEAESKSLAHKRVARAATASGKNGMAKSKTRRRHVLSA